MSTFLIKTPCPQGCLLLNANCECGNIMLLNYFQTVIERTS
jgi:hypothetical protein